MKILAILHVGTPQLQCELILTQLIMPTKPLFPNKACCRTPPGYCSTQYNLCAANLALPGPAGHRSGSGPCREVCLCFPVGQLLLALEFLEPSLCVRAEGLTLSIAHLHSGVCPHSSSPWGPRVGEAPSLSTPSSPATVSSLSHHVGFRPQLPAPGGLCLKAPPHSGLQALRIC